MKLDHKHLPHLKAEARILEAEIKVAVSMASVARTTERSEYWMAKAIHKEKRWYYTKQLIAKHEGEV